MRDEGVVNSGMLATDSNFQRKDEQDEEKILEKSTHAD